jgi:hypothetical protein
MNRWIENRSGETSASVKINNIVHLRLDDHFSYLVKALVTGTSQDRFTAKVVGIYDWGTKINLAICEKEKLEVLTKENLELKQSYIHKIVFSNA